RTTDLHVGDRCGPPPDFPLASPCPGIVHHLSGTIACALAPPPRRSGREGAGGAPPRRRGGGSHLGRGGAGLHLHCATGRVGSRHRRRPRAPFGTRAGPRPGGAARSGDGLRTVRPGRQPRRERRGPAPRPPQGEEGAEVLARGPGGASGEVGGGEGAVKLEAGAHEPPSPPDPSKPNRSRSRRTASEEVRPTAAETRAARGPPAAPDATPRRGNAGGLEAEHTPPRQGRPHRRVESPGQTVRTPPVYLLTVSRPVELSLQSSFQLSLTVLVRYRSRAGI
ncbi:hypothetical protein P4O66_020701, partial [Electrophorus voltai]